MVWCFSITFHLRQMDLSASKQLAARYHSGSFFIAAKCREILIPKRLNLLRHHERLPVVTRQESVRFLVINKLLRAGVETDLTPHAV